MQSSGFLEWRKLSKGLFIFSCALSFLKDCREELWMVSWLSTSKLATSVKVVLVSIFLFAFLLYVTDITIYFLLNRLLGILNMIGSAV